MKNKQFVSWRSNNRVNDQKNVQKDDRKENKTEQRILGMIATKQDIPSEISGISTNFINAFRILRLWTRAFTIWIYRKDVYAWQFLTIPL